MEEKRIYVFDSNPEPASFVFLHILGWGHFQPGKLTKLNLESQKYTKANFCSNFILLAGDS